MSRAVIMLDGFGPNTDMARRGRAQTLPSSWSGSKPSKFEAVDIEVQPVSLSPSIMNVKQDSGVWSSAPKYSVKLP
jgi:hypothetical protein